MIRRQTARRTRSGFTLVEVLIAIAILLIGVVAALRIFPRGFDIFTETQQSAIAEKLISQQTAEIQQDPETVPDAVESNDFVTSPPSDLMGSAIGDYLNDLRPVEMRSTATAWYTQQLYPESDGPSWPLYEPRAVRGVSKLLGLKVHIPTDFNGSAAFAPIYVPHYAPIIPAGHFDAASGSYQLYAPGGTPQPLAIYDLRYRALPSNQLRYYARMAISQAVASGVTYTGTDPTHNDLQIACHNPDALATYTLTLVSDSAPYSFTWTDSTGNSGTAQTDTTTTLSHGVVVSFATPANHRVGETWTFQLQYPDTALAYAVDPAGQSFQLLSANYARVLRVTFHYYDEQNVMQRCPTPTFTGQPVVPVASGKAAITLSDLQGLGLLPAGDTTKWHITPGSEQINRAYQYDSTDPVNALPTGTYFVPLPAGNSASDFTLLGAITFSRADAGRTVKMDYSLADWNILHEDVTVDNDGYLTLSVPDPKVSNKPNYPREPVTLGLYHALNSNTQDPANAVIGAINLRTGLVTHIGINHPNDQHNLAATPYWWGTKSGDAAAAWHPVADVQAQFSPSLLSAVSLDDSARGRIRVGTASTGGGDPSWGTLVGQTFRVFYRARRDWTVQVLRAPALFGAYRLTGPVVPNVPLPLGWDLFAQDTGNPSRLYVSGVHVGQTLAVDYAYWDLSRATTLATLSAPATVSAPNAAYSLTVDDTSALRAKQAIHLLAPGSTTVLTAQVASIDSATAVTVTNVVTTAGTALPTGTTLIQAPLVRINGETHAVPTPDTGDNYSAINLSQLPATNAVITVRGVSVTVRAIWAQPRNGTAVVYDAGGVVRERPINQRWQSRAVTMLLQPTRE